MPILITLIPNYAPIQLTPSPPHKSLGPIHTYSLCFMTHEIGQSCVCVPTGLELSSFLLEPAGLSSGYTTKDRSSPFPGVYQ